MQPRIWARLGQRVLVGLTHSWRKETHVLLRAGASTVGPGGPGGFGEQRMRRKKGASSELSPILAEVETEQREAQAAQDILDQARPEDLLEVSASDEGSGLKAGPLAKKMWSCARRGVRSEEVWARFAQRVLMTGTLIGATDISLMFRAFARIKYRDARALDTLSPFILRHIDSFNTEELVLLLLAHKKLEYERTDNLHLLLNVLCQRREEWTGKDVALISNAVAHFYIYRPRFWRLAAMSLNRLVWDDESTGADDPRQCHGASGSAGRAGTHCHRKDVPPLCPKAPLQPGDTCDSHECLCQAGFQQRQACQSL